MEKNLLLAAIMGVAVGDALGLPVQFYSRERCQRMHVTQMLDWEFPNGTYSDDTAMTLCTLASLKENDWQLDEEDIMERFVASFAILKPYTANIYSTILYNSKGK